MNIKEIIKKYAPALVVVGAALLITILGAGNMSSASGLNKVGAVACVGVAAYLAQRFWYFNKPGGEVASSSKVSGFVIGALAALMIAAGLTLG